MNDNKGEVILHKVLKGIDFRNKMKEELKDTIINDKLKPALVIGVVGNDEASEVYVRNKVKLATEVGIEAVIVKCEEDSSTNEFKFALEEKILSLKADEYQVSSMVQLPVPSHIDLSFLQGDLFVETDVEGTSRFNVASLELSKNKQQDESIIVPCTARGIIDILEENDIAIEGKVALVIGRSDIVGNPVAKLLMNRNATVIQAHSRSSKEQLVSLGQKADIVVVSIGVKEHIDYEVFSDNTTIIDVGIHRNEDGSLTGDVDMKSVLNEHSNISYTPVPGGVGPLTVVELMKNTVVLSKLNKV